MKNGSTCCICSQTDFLLVLLRDMVHAYPQLRVILMSATVDTTLFTEYFGNCQVVEVYGRTHPVQGKKTHSSIGTECFHRGSVRVHWQTELQVWIEELLQVKLVYQLGHYTIQEIKKMLVNSLWCNYHIHFKGAGWS